MSQPIKVKIMNEKEPIKIKATSNFPTVNVGGETDHSKLKNLDYEHSGHIGFASSEDIPTKVSQLENDKDYIDNNVSNLVNYELKGKTGTNLGVSIDNTTYVMTIDLKNTAGDVISTGSVDLPLESMVIGASYDDSTKEIVLTLQSGEEVKFSVADLVSGLVSQSTFDTKMNEISQEFNHKFDMPYYYEYNGDTDFEDTSETTLAMFNEIKELMEAGQKPCIIVKKGATGANSYITYHFIVPQFGSLDTTYIILKGSPVRKDGNTFNLVSLNCEKDPETNQIKRVYEKKADGSITIASEPHYVWNGSTGSEAKELFQKVYDAWHNENKILNVDYYRGNTKLKLIGIGNPRLLSNQMLCEFISLDPPYHTTNSVPLQMVGARVDFDTTGLVTNVALEQLLGDYKLIREYNGSYGALPIDNTRTFAPTGNYNPSTKLYTDQRVQSIAPDYDATSTYKVGDYVSYQGKFYKCTTAIETAEAWNSEHWSETTVKDEFSNILYWEWEDTSEKSIALFQKVYDDMKNNKKFNMITTVQWAYYKYVYVSTSCEFYQTSTNNGYLRVKFSDIGRDMSSGSKASYTSLYTKSVMITITNGIATAIDVDNTLETKLLNQYDYNFHFGGLSVVNTEVYTPKNDYNPATKKYVDDAVASAGGGDSVFKVTLTANQTAGYDANKTIDEIQTAISANKIVIAVVGSDEYPLKYHTETELRFTSIELNRSVLVLYSDGVWTMQDTNMLKTSGGYVNGNINMNSHAITNIQKLHVDGEAPVYIGSTIETGVTNASRITGIAGGGVAIVRANTQGTYDPLFVANPTNVNHAATKGYVDNKLTSIQGYDATKTQTLKNINGVLTWQTDGE